MTTDTSRKIANANHEELATATTSKVSRHGLSKGLRRERRRRRRAALRVAARAHFADQE